MIAPVVALTETVPLLAVAGDDRGWIDGAIDIGIVADHAKHDGGIFIGGYAIVDRDRARR